MNKPRPAQDRTICMPLRRTEPEKDWETKGVGEGKDAEFRSEPKLDGVRSSECCSETPIAGYVARRASRVTLGSQNFTPSAADASRAVRRQLGAHDCPCRATPTRGTRARRPPLAAALTPLQRRLSKSGRLAAKSRVATRRPISRAPSAGTRGFLHLTRWAGRVPPNPVLERARHTRLAQKMC